MSSQGPDEPEPDTFCGAEVAGAAVGGAEGEDGIKVVGPHRHANPIVNEANTSASDLRWEVFEARMGISSRMTY
jgi:hypothetical protein